MALDTTPNPEEIRSAQADNPKLRARDLADKLGISEAQLIAANVGVNATRIDAHPDRLMPLVPALGEVMALTRTGDCVHEKIGSYGEYHSGAHAGMVLTDAIDLRIFPKFWAHGFAVETKTETGTRRSLQVFDPAGDAVHKIFLRDGSDLEAWETALAQLRLEDQSQTLEVAPRAPTEAAKSNPDKLDILRGEWAKMTDTHQFMTLVARLRMNRLGAYRIAGAPYVRPLQTGAVDKMLNAVQQAGIEIMVFVGNRGCIQIHSGPIETLKMMGPWQNVLDPDFNLHLRLDKVAEVWAVEKPTKRGAAVSVEAFDANGGVIFQAFGVGKEGRNSRPAWDALVAKLPGLDTAEAL